MKVKNLLDTASLILSISGYVPEHRTVVRTVVMLGSLTLSFGISYFFPHHQLLAILYFSVSTGLYIGFIYTVLPKHGYRLWFIQKFSGEQSGYLVYEGVLGFLFFHNGASIGYFASVFSNTFHIPISTFVTGTVACICFIVGFVIKLWAARVVSVDIYYWKDMFLGRKITNFAISGPYKYFANPMYGIGQLQSYALALWYLSWPGLIIAFINQALVFSFYYSCEKKFIREVYSRPPITP